ncbi:hypothetical protein QTG54_003505 [Skeletonema marinoi]|uniref:Uncharacterized protein n=1 Tax=Skeletonema marinoi TaxID=267567 RepID=A0AAD8YFI6_9STRA|nr:hypothetical protein QTG54_003505 [Skeletonema marinoi]
MARYLFILALIATGASAFYKGAVPQQEGPKIPAAAAGLLDNPAVASDPNINPARKCGFCMGVMIRADELPRLWTLSPDRNSSDISGGSR